MRVEDLIQSLVERVSTGPGQLIGGDSQTRRPCAVLATTHSHAGSVVRRIDRGDPPFNHGLLGGDDISYRRSSTTTAIATGWRSSAWWWATTSIQRWGSCAVTICGAASGRCASAPAQPGSRPSGSSTGRPRSSTSRTAPASWRRASGRGSFQTELANDDSLTLTYTGSYEFLPEPFQISRGVTLPVGGYSFDDVRFAYNMAQQRSVRANLSFSLGSFYRPPVRCSTCRTGWIQPSIGSGMRTRNRSALANLVEPYAVPRFWTATQTLRPFRACSSATLTTSFGGVAAMEISAASGLQPAPAPAPECRRTFPARRSPRCWGG